MWGSCCIFALDGKPRLLALAQTLPSLGCSSPAVQGAQPQERQKSTFCRMAFLKKGLAYPRPEVWVSCPSFPQSPGAGSKSRARSPTPHRCRRRHRGRWERPLREDTAGQDLLLHPGAERGRAGSWPAELLSPPHRNRHRVPTKGKLSALLGWPHPSLPIRATFGSRLCYPDPLCSPAAHHPPNLDKTWTHWHSDTFLIPAERTSLPSGHLSPVEVLPVLSLPSTRSCPAQQHHPSPRVAVTGRVTTCHPTA